MWASRATLGDFKDPLILISYPQPVSPPSVSTQAGGTGGGPRQTSSQRGLQDFFRTFFFRCQDLKVLIFSH